MPQTMSRAPYNIGAAAPMRLEETNMPPSPLSPAEVQTRLSTLHDWQLQGDEIVRTLTLPDFRAALSVVNKIGDLAEAAGHHPDIDIRYNRVRLALVTHDAGGLTAKDFDLAAQIDALG